MKQKDEVNMALKEATTKNADRLPKEAFAIVGDPEAPATWKLPHHTRVIRRALTGRLNIERTVDWDQMSVAVAALSAGGNRGKRVQASPGEIIAAARHLADHYREAGTPLPDILAALV